MSIILAHDNNEGQLTRDTNTLLIRRSERPVLRDGIKLDVGPAPASPEHDEPEAEPDEARPRGPGGTTAAPGSLELFFASVCQSARRLPAHAQATLKRQVYIVPTRSLLLFATEWPGRVGH